MIRAKVKAFGQDYGDRILIRSLSELHSYFDETFNGIVKETVRTTYDRVVGRSKSKYIGHALDSFVTAVEFITDITGISPIYATIDLFGSVEKSMRKLVSDGYWLVIDPFNKVSYFTIKPDDPTVEFEIISEKEKYTRDDIKIYKWENGSHWYAKIGLMDVVVNNEQKWNAKWVAQKKAEEFLETL